MRFRGKHPSFTEEQMRERLRVRELIRARNRVNSCWTEMANGRRWGKKAVAEEQEPEPCVFSAKKERVEELGEGITSMSIWKRAGPLPCYVSSAFFAACGLAVVAYAANPVGFLMIGTALVASVWAGKWARAVPQRIEEAKEEARRLEKQE